MLDRSWQIHEPTIHNPRRYAARPSPNGVPGI